MRLSEEDFAQLTLDSVINPRGYGEVLGSALFTGKTREAFLEARAREPAGLSVLLFVEDKPLQRLYWGRLCAPVEKEWWDFLLLNQRSVFSLYLPSSTDRAYRPIGQRDLRALLVVAQPTDLAAYHLATFDDAATVQSLRTALGAIHCDVLAATPDADGPPTLEELCRRLSTGQYTLLHLVAHGQVKAGETSLFLTNEQNLVKRVIGESLIRELRRQAQLPHFIFLATCHSAQPNAGLEGLAQRLVTQLGVPTVVAMTEAVTIDTAADLATAFYQQLRTSGAPDEALAQACAGLTERSDITVPVLYSRLGGRPLFSDTQDRELTPAEERDGLARLARLLPVRAPVLLPTFQQNADWLRPVISTGRYNLAAPAQAEWDSAWAVVSKICDEALDLNFRALALGHEPPPYDARCPFRGLLAFGYDDREFFFGREALVEKLQSKLAAHNFLPVLGPSGSGKSSVVLAGLLPALLEAETDLIWASFTPGSEPLAQLAAALNKLGVGINETSATKGGSQFLLVVDQFEELFTLCKDEQIRRTFLARLLDLAQVQRLIITMRADFWGDCAPYTALKEAMQAQQELIAPLNMAELRSVMEQQGKAVGLHFEADLANTILDAVADEPGAMPLLQHLLLELWKRRHGHWLLTGEYHSLGGIRKAIARTADRLYDNLSSDEQRLVRHIFVRLTRLALDQGPGEEHRNTRQRIVLPELVTSGYNVENVRNLVNRLADARLVVTNQHQVEVAHEALIRHWPRLQEWIKEDRAAVALRETIQSAAITWKVSRRPDFLVHRGDQLRAAMKLLNHPRIHLSLLEVEYMESCLRTARSSFHITIDQGTPNEWPVVVEYLPREGRLPLLFEGTLRLDSITYEQLAGGLAFSDQYGRQLGRALFQGEMYTAFVQAWAEKAERLRISLTVKDLRLQRLRWETLHAPLSNGQWDFISTEPKAIYSLVYASRVEYTCRPVNHDGLRALICIANPIDEKNEAAVLDAEEIVTYVRNSLGSIQCDILGRVPGACGPATLEMLCQKLSTGVYAIVHIVAHGVFNQSKKTSGVRFEDATNKPDVLSINEFIERLKSLGDHWTRPLFLYFDAGLSSDLRHVSTKGQLGVRLITEIGIVSVLAMTREVSLQTSKALTQNFYPRFLEHGEPDLALAETRDRLFEFSDIFVPFMYSGLQEYSILLEKNMQVMNRSCKTTEIELTIHQQTDDNDSWPVTSIFRGSERWLPNRSEDVLHLKIKDLKDKLGNPKAYGALLGQALLHSTLQENIARELVAGTSNIHVRLWVKAPELKSLQWEWLCVPTEDGSWKFVAATPRFSFSRILFSKFVQSPPCLDCDSLKALVLVALPNNLDPTRFSSVVGVAENLSSIFKDMKTDILSLRWAEGRPATLASLFEEIDRTQYAILHIVAHVALSQLESEPVILLEGNHGQLDLIRPLKFLKRLKAARHLPLFIFLISPFPNDPGGSEALALLARMMIEELGIVAVLAVTGMMSIDTNELFAQALYRQLRAHGEIDRAFGEACVEVNHRPDFVPPVLFSRLKGLPLFYCQSASSE